MSITACREYQLRVKAYKYAEKHIEALTEDVHETIQTCDIVDLSNIDKLDICQEANAQMSFFIREAYRNIAMSLLDKI